MQWQAPAPSSAPQKESRGIDLPSGRSRSASAFSHPLRPSISFLFAILALFLFAAPRTGYTAENAYYHIQEIKPNVFVWVAKDILDQEGDPEFNRAGNAGFIITHDGVVVVNTTNTPFNARALLFEIRRRTSLPVRYVINTSASPDVMLGNEAFEDFQPVILSTPQAAQQMHQYRNEFPARVERNWKIAASMRGIHPLPPTETFDKDTTLQVGGLEIRLINLGDNASPGDAAVYLPESKVAFLGNVFENEYVPRIGSANISQWIATLRKVESWSVDVYVPGHGEPAGKAQVQQFRGFLEWLCGRVSSGLQMGKSLMQVQDELVPFQSVHWHAPELEREAVAAVYRSLATSKRQVSSSSESTSP